MQELSFCKCRLCAEGICDEIHQLYIDPITKNTYLYNHPVINGPEYTSFNLPETVKNKTENITTTTGKNPVSISSANGGIILFKELGSPEIVISNDFRVQIPFTVVSDTENFKVEDGYIKVIRNLLLYDINFSIDVIINFNISTLVTVYISIYDNYRKYLGDVGSTSQQRENGSMKFNVQSTSKDAKLFPQLGYFVSVEARSSEIDGASVQNVVDQNGNISPALNSTISLSDLFNCPFDDCNLL